MKKIRLTRGRFALVDDADYKRVSKHSWRCDMQNGTPYAYSKIGIQMGRFIMRPDDPKQVVDHKNLDTLDNRRRNLRICTIKENVRNSKQRTHYAGNPVASQYKGVTFEKSKRSHPSPWKARIVVDYRQIYLGMFETPEQAAHAYNAAAIEHFGEFARLNEVPA